ncbi:hypothetical protein HB762_27155 (plasmid) [Vibrio campbellii]|uniref:Uncharacterized protein n=1 Tax=Vibrio campbellii TaxID=680 RepID=A0ABY5ILL4_9VIBR|nr:hypothetical protein [Vibrio campbellii]UTZ34944.1 hypothetical protein HB762_27155 [Vibrio campbellii]
MNGYSIINSVVWLAIMVVALLCVVGLWLANQIGVPFSLALDTVIKVVVVLAFAIFLKFTMDIPGIPLVTLIAILVFISFTPVLDYVGQSTQSMPSSFYDGMGVNLAWYAQTKVQIAIGVAIFGLGYYLQSKR